MPNTSNKSFQSPLDDPDFSKILLERLGQTGTLVLDVEGAICYVSKRTERLLGAPQKKLLGHGFFDVINIRNDKGEQIFERKHPVYQALHERDFNQVTPFFTTLKLEDDLVPVALRVIQMSAKRKITGVIVEMREVKRVLNVGEMKSLFVSFAAHQLKTPSSIVKGFLELMMREGEKAYSRDQWYNLQSAFESNENLIQLSKTLLNLTRLEGGMIEPKIAPFNPNSVLQSKVDAHRPFFSKKQLQVKLNAIDGVFHTDELFFSEIFDTLFSNAVKYSPPGAIITVECNVAKHKIEVIVRDQGVGISKAEAELLFTTASDIDPDHDSHGLGLLMAKKYVTLLGGTIGLREQDEPGAALYFILPTPLI